jgi:hypothetical protein
VSASSDVFNFTQADFVTCRLRVDGAIMADSTRQIELNGADPPNANQEENCATNGTLAVPAGTHTIDFEGAGLATGTVFDESSLQVLFVPLGATGVPPAL